MSYTVTKNIRDYLVSSSSVTSLVDTGNIRVAWGDLPDSFPCIIIQQVGGSDVGYLGYNTTAAGYKIRREEATLQLDIYSTTSRTEVLNIADAVVPVMISGGCRKTTDIDVYNDSVEAHRKIQTYILSQFHDD
jgi:hypothetical protein